MSNIDWKEFGFDTPTPASEEDNQIENIFEKEYGSDVKIKYDRQVRLWGWLAQRRIDQCSVLLLNCSACGCECLKNLILPGIGRFAICDNRKVTIRDLGNNFYLCADDLGKDLATSAARILGELNSEVRGNVILMDPEKLIEENPIFFDNYQNIIASQLPYKVVCKLSVICKQKGINLIYIRSYGMCGYVRLFGHNHCIIESKLDNPVEDLRLHSPWEMLSKFAKIQNIEMMNDNDLSHTGFPVILLRAAQKYREENNFEKEKKWLIPRSKKSKERLQQIIKSMCSEEAQKRLMGLPKNFQEAMQKTYLVCDPVGVPDPILVLMEHEFAQAENITSSTPIFWILVYGISMYYKNEGINRFLPNQGRVPDMECDTIRYIRLQSLYRRQHRLDCSIIRKYICSLFESKKISSEHEPSKEEISFFCKYCYNLRAISYNPIHKELESLSSKQKLISKLKQDESCAYFYLCLRSIDIFYEKFGYYPGEDLKLNDNQILKQRNQLLQIMEQFYKNLVSSSSSSSSNNNNNGNINIEKNVAVNLKKFAHTFTRFGGSEIHTISSLLGGVVGQEIIKLCTKQRLPFDNTWIFNGLNSSSISIKL